MTEKVLGALRKDVNPVTEFEANGVKYALFPKDKLVPVRLKSESVGIEWLEEEIKKAKGNADSDLEIYTLEGLLSAAKKKADEGGLP